ncbi:hypothetical protein RI129_004268 [Pyrocoelia pectoralis]|uniref:EF-hand domain-containing protein n=1 Tax=Pyrocoelia pectoralis TaxID=417401 RepID=A0AAN7VGF5_9COLE
MKLNTYKILHVFERWSYLVPILSYFTLFCTIWILSVPLKSNKTKSPNQFHLYSRNKLLQHDFVIKMKNSNFNSDKVEAENQLLNVKGDYLINLNGNNNNKVHVDPTAVLEDVFRKADENKDKKLDSKELSRWIRLKIIEHITVAVGSNYALFTQIDTNPKNGVISWKEYHSYFLKKRGFSSKYVHNHDEKRHKGLHRSIKEQIMRDKASWMEAAKSDPDTLTLDEFLAFTHPESSAANHLTLVDELYDKFDRDGDELLTEDEFAVLQTQGDEDEMVIIRQDENERRAEFRKSVDLNGDGKADRRELLHYVAPQSPRHSEHEAEALLALADSDHDNMLSLEEILAHPDLFLKSKMVDTAQSFHDEF